MNTRKERVRGPAPDALISEGRIQEHTSGLGTITEEMVRHRAREFAQINSRPDGRPTPSDWDQARLELMGNAVPPADESEAFPSAKRWDAVPGSTGRRVHEQGVDDEQTYAERLTGEGAREAEHERMKMASEETRADKDIDRV